MLLALLLSVIMGRVSQGANLEGIKINEDGSFNLAGIKSTILFYDANWEATPTANHLRPDAGFPQITKDAWRLEGRYAVSPVGTFHLEQTMTRVAAGSVSYRVHLKAEGREGGKGKEGEAIKTNTLCLSLSLPVDRYAGQKMIADQTPVLLPASFKQPILFNKGGVNRLILPGENLEVQIDGPANIMVQDNRKWDASDFVIRIMFTPGGPEIAEADLQLRFTLRKEGMTVPQAIPFTIQAGPQWKPLTASQDVEAGSILDFSNLLDAPAGKYGRVIVKGSHFAFARQPEMPSRFFGTNLCFTANYPEHDQAEKIADRLARMGYNSVRLHHYDGELVDPKAADSVTLDKDQLDKIDYLVAACKKRGIYITIDLYTFRQTRAEEIPEINLPVRAGYKALVPILASAMQNWQAFARNLMTHKNPFTGFTWAQEPALMGICPLNEDPLATDYHATPEIAALYEKRFAAWLKTNNLTEGTEAQRKTLISRFLLETQLDANRRIYKFLKEDLQVQAPLTGVNCVNSLGLTPVRAEFDYVDNHSYWDHPGFPEKIWSLPFSYRNNSVVAAGALVPRNMFATRIVGKPFACTEWNYCVPNRYRAEGGPVMGAYAALQDWDGIWRFAYSHQLANMLKMQPAAGFDIGIDPLNLLSERIAALLYARGDVSPAKEMITYKVDLATAQNTSSGWGGGEFPEAFQLLGLRSRIGSISQEKGPAVNPEWEKQDIKSATFTSDTGQITLIPSAGMFKVITPRSESFVLGNATPVAGQSVEVTGDGNFATVCVAAMDGKPVARSNHLLLIHLTDLQNTNIAYLNAKQTQLEEWGKLPHLVRTGKVALQLKREAAGKNPVLYPLDQAGRRQKPLDFATDGNTLLLHLDTRKTPEPCMAYELVVP